MTTSTKTSNGTSAAPFINELRTSVYQNKSPEIHNLIRFQNAIMMKYYQTQDPHFKNVANALKPQIEDKIRAFNVRNNID